MTRKSTKSAMNPELPAQPNPDKIALIQNPDETPGGVLAKAMLGQNLRHGHVASVFAGGMLGNSGEKLGLTDCAKVVQQRATNAIDGDLDFASAMLASQAITLDNMFTEMARRASYNMRDYPQAMEIYMRLALKAQSNSRATLEALAKMHQPREQTVRHVHVNEGGQAIVANQFHHHGGQENGKSANQPHAIESDGTAFGQPLRRKNARREAVPLASNA